MSQTERCPVCEGRGELTRLRARGDCAVSPYTKGMFLCHRCNGFGTIDNLLGTTTWTTPAPNSNPIVTTGIIPTGGVSIGGTSPNTEWINYKTDDYTLSSIPAVEVHVGEGGCVYALDDNGEANTYLGVLVDGASCACSPEGESHSDDCKGAI